MRATPLFAKDVALVAGRPALLISQAMDDLLRRERRLNGGGAVPADLASTLDAIRRAADAYRAEQTEATEALSTEAVVHSEGQAIVPDLTAEQVGHLLGVSDRRVRQLRSAELLPARWVRGRWMFDQAVVHEYARERECR